MDLNVAPEVISLTKLEWNTWVSRWQKKGDILTNRKVEAIKNMIPPTKNRGIKIHKFSQLLMWHVGPEFTYVTTTNYYNLRQC